MKKLWIALILLALLLSSCTATYTENGFVYEVEDGVRRITDLSGETALKEIVVFPSNDDWGHVIIGNKLTFIDGATRSIYSMNMKVAIIKTVDRIDRSAFTGIDTLEFVVLVSDTMIPVTAIFTHAITYVPFALLDDYKEQYRNKAISYRLVASKVSFYVEDKLYWLSYDDEESIMLPPEPEKEDNEFMGWFNKVDDTKFDFDIDSGDLENIEVYAKWRYL